MNYFEIKISPVCNINLILFVLVTMLTEVSLQIFSSSLCTVVVSLVVLNIHPVATAKQ